jgi:hypothetical protein
VPPHTQAIIKPNTNPPPLQDLSKTAPAGDFPVKIRRILK